MLVLKMCVGLYYNKWLMQILSFSPHKNSVSLGALFCNFSENKIKV